MGLFGITKSSTTTQQQTTNNYDQRQVNDASGGGAVGTGNAINSGNTIVSYSTDPGVQHINDTNAALLATLGQQQGDTMSVIAGLGTAGIKQMGESATNLFSQAEQNSATVWTHTLDASQDAMDKMFSASANILNAGTTLAQGAMSTYQPADSKASDNQVKIALLGAAAVVVAAFIAKSRG